MMNFEAFLSQAWAEHGNDARKVASQLPGAFSLIEKSEQIPPMAQLISHVMGEHLGEWQSAIDLVTQLTALPCYIPDTEASVRRHVASMQMASGQMPDTQLGKSDHVRALAAAASALAAQRNVERSRALFMEALEQSTALADKDPALTSLAATGNNMACTLEEMSERAPEETELMLFAAQTARRCWEKAGTWIHVERAEYRLAHSYLKAERANEARIHAETCLRIVQEHDAEPLEFFFAYEALALAQKASGTPAHEAATRARAYYEQLPADQKTWCASSLKKIENI